MGGNPNNYGKTNTSTTKKKTTTNANNDTVSYSNPDLAHTNAGYGPGSNVRGGHSGRGGKAPVIAGKVLQAAGITPTDDTTPAANEQAGYDAAAKALAAATAASKGTGSSGPSALDRYTQQLQAMLTGGSYRQPYDQLQTQLQNIYGQAGGQITTAMDNLDTFLKGQTNPYANIQAQTTQVTPALNEMLQSQGVSTNPLQQLAAVTQAQNAGQATAFNNLIGTLSGIQSANQTGQLGDVAQQRADFQNQLTNSNLGYGAQLQQQASDKQQSLMTMLLTALSKGGNPKKGKLF